MNENSNSNPITPFHGIYIIDANSGLALLSNEFSDKHLDEDLVSGMFRALEMFINHLAYSNTFELIQEINFQGLRIIYERYGAVNPILGVAVSKMVDLVQNEHRLLREILEEFYETYKPTLANFRGNVAPFQSFRARIASYNLKNGNSLLKKEGFITPQSVQSPRFPTFHGFQTIDS